MGPLLAHIGSGIAFRGPGCMDPTLATLWLCICKKKLTTVVIRHKLSGVSVGHGGRGPGYLAPSARMIATPLHIGPI